jgi:hypothetical protein
MKTKQQIQTAESQNISHEVIALINGESLKVAFT